MGINSVPKKQDLDTLKLVEQFFLNGGTVKSLPPFQHSETIEYTKGFYGKKPKTTKTTQSKDTD